MNTKAQSNCNGTDSVQINSFVQFGDFENQPKIANSAVEKVVPEDCLTVSEWSVKQLRKFFMQKNLEYDELNGKSVAVAEADDALKIKQHYEGSELYETSSTGTDGGKSVKELKQLYEAKVRALSASSHKNVEYDHPSVCTYSRPSTAGTDERQDIVSLETPHPDGQNALVDEPVKSKTTTRWYVASSSISEVPNGLQVSLVLMNDQQ